MTTPAFAGPSEVVERWSSWLPLIVIALGQMLLFNIMVIPVSMGGMVESLGLPSTDVGTAIVMLSLGVTAFIVLGARLKRPYGAPLVFSVVAVVAIAPCHWLPGNRTGETPLDL